MGRYRLFKDTFVARGSALSEALAKDEKEALKVYKEVMERYKNSYCQEDRDWFEERQRQAIAMYKNQSK